MPKWTTQQLAATKAGRKFVAAELARAAIKLNPLTTLVLATSILSGPALLEREHDSITLTLPYPPSANRYWRSIVIKGAVRVLVSTEARQYKAKCAALAAAAFKRPFEGPVGIKLLVHRPIRRGDLGNRIKVIEDVLQGFAYADDAQIERIEAQRFDDKLNPRVVVSVWKINATI